jgi:hypothetical protein
MPRPEAPIEATGPLAKFAADLRALRTSADVSYRAMEEREHFSYTTFSKAASGQQLPTLAVTKAYVRACQGDVEEWTARWRRVSDVLQHATTERIPAELLATRRPRGRRAHRVAKSAQCEESATEVDAEIDFVSADAEARTSRPRLPELLSVIAITAVVASWAVGAWFVPDGRVPQQLAAEPSSSSVNRVVPASLPFEMVDVLDSALTLSPGARGKRVVRLTNPNSADLVVTDLQVTVEPGEDENGKRIEKCIAPLVKVVSSPSLPISVSAGRSAEAEFVLEMSTSPPSECQAVSFPLSYSGSAVVGTVVGGVSRTLK